MNGSVKTQLHRRSIGVVCPGVHVYMGSCYRPKGNTKKCFNFSVHSLCLIEVLYLLRWKLLFTFLVVLDWRISDSFSTFIFIFVILGEDICPER